MSSKPGTEVGPCPSGGLCLFRWDWSSRPVMLGGCRSLAVLRGPARLQPLQPFLPPATWLMAARAPGCRRGGGRPGTYEQSVTPGGHWASVSCCLLFLLQKLLPDDVQPGGQGVSSHRAEAWGWGFGPRSAEPHFQPWGLDALLVRVLSLGDQKTPKSTWGKERGPGVRPTIQISTGAAIPELGHLKVQSCPKAPAPDSFSHQPRPGILLAVSWPGVLALDGDSRHRG